MTCNRTVIGPDVVMWECGRRESKPPCDVCKAYERHVQCKFALRGKLEGRLCDRWLCARCTSMVDGIAMCAAHEKFTREHPVSAPSPVVPTLATTTSCRSPSSYSTARGTTPKDGDRGGRPAGVGADLSLDDGEGS